MTTPENDRRIDYIELPAHNYEASKAFYGEVFGWSFTDYGPGYCSFDDGRLQGGLDASVTGAKGGALVVFYAHDLESTLTRTRKAGATITREIFSFPGGRRFQFLDPSGNELAVWCLVPAS
ncbi:MAG: VOC family protein [Nannocystaceae bacterium]